MPLGQESVRRCFVYDVLHVEWGFAFEFALVHCFHLLQVLRIAFLILHEAVRFRLAVLMVRNSQCKQEAGEDKENTHKR
jgi:hypothetical protein